MLACYVSSLFLRRPPLDPPAVINHPGWKPAGKRMAPSGKKKEKPKERPDAATMVSHFVKRKKKKGKKKDKACAYHCACGTTTLYSAHDSDSKNQYLEKCLLVT